MLTVNPKKRISSSASLKSDWIANGDTALEERQLNVKKLQNLVEGKRKLRAGIQTVCIHGADYRSFYQMPLTVFCFPTSLY
jgi:hypothetical protein